MTSTLTPEVPIVLAGQDVRLGAQIVCDSTPRNIRAAVRSALRGKGLPDGVLDDVLLIVSELVTNVVRYAPGPTEVTVDQVPGRVVVTCSDRWYGSLRRGLLCVPPPAEDDSESGRGLFLVAALATGGVVVHRRPDGGKTITATILTGGAQ